MDFQASGKSTGQLNSTADPSATMEEFLRDTNNMMFRSSSGQFEIKRTDCAMMYRDKNLCSFVRGLEIKKKRAKHCSKQSIG